MKKLLLLIFAAAVAGCTQVEEHQCTFNHARVIATETGTGKTLHDQKIDDCFTVNSLDSVGLVVINGAQSSETFEVGYNNAKDLLNLRFNGQVSRWRKRKDVDIQIKGDAQSDSIVVTFADQPANVNGRITFTK